MPHPRRVIDTVDNHKQLSLAALSSGRTALIRLQSVATAQKHANYAGVWKIYGSSLAMVSYPQASERPTWGCRQHWWMNVARVALWPNFIHAFATPRVLMGWTVHRRIYTPKFSCRARVQGTCSPSGKNWRTHASFPIVVLLPVTFHKHKTLFRNITNYYICTAYATQYKNKWRCHILTICRL